MNLAKRLALLLAVPLAALVPLGVILHLQLQTIEERGKFVSDMQVPSLAIIGKVTRTFGEMRAQVRDYLQAPGDKERAEAVLFRPVRFLARSVVDRVRRAKE